MSDALPDPKTQRGTTATKFVGGARFDGATGGDHPASLYTFDSIANTVHGLDNITESHYTQYRDEGYIAVEEAFPPELINDAIQALEHQIVEGRSRDGRTVIQNEAWAADKLDRLAPPEKLRAARKLTGFANSAPSLTALTYDPKMLKIVSQLMNGAQPKLLQEMALLKPPGGREKPWHQDRAYFNIHPNDPIVGVWVALDEATPENGCMRLWPGRHKQGPIGHLQKRDWQICDGDIRTSGRVAVPLKPGGVLFFHCLLPHGTPKNATNQRRWAIQFHFHPDTANFTTDDERLAVFGPEGKNAEC